jgi:Creatinase/Prolidase N-terminal domain
MKRGLAVLDPAETSPETFAARLEAVRRRAEDSAAAVVLIYGDVSRSGDIHYLTNLCLYWNEAVLAIPVAGKPALVTKLSKRVQPWMRRTTILEDIRSGPRLAESIGKLLDERAGRRTGRIALVDMQWWPSELVAELRSALPEAELEDLGAIVRDGRLLPAAEELSLLRRGAQLLDRAMGEAWARSGDAHERTSVAVRNIRRAGFQDAVVRCGKLADGSEFADAVGQYHYVWLRESSPRGGPAAKVATGALDAALGAARPGATEARLSRLVADRLGGRFSPEFSCMPHPDIETRGLFRTRADAERPLENGEIVCLTLSVAGEAGVLAAAKTAEITPGGAVALVGRENE